MTQCLAELPLQTAWRVDLFRDAHHHHYHHHQRHISDICLWIKSSRRTRGWAPGLLCLRARVGGRGGDGDDGIAMRHRFAGRGTFRGVHMRSGFRGRWIDVVWWKGNLLYVLDTAWEDAIGRVRVCHSSPSLPSQISWVAPFRRCRILPCYKGQRSPRSTHHLAAVSSFSGTSIRSTLPIQLITNATFVAKARSIWSTVVQ